MLGFNWIIQHVRLGIDFAKGVAFLFIGRLLPPLHPDGKDLEGKTAIVTGGNSGVGLGIALQLAEMGAFVVLACRNENKALEAKAQILSASPSAKVTTLPLDNASLASVRKFAREWRYGQIDYIFLNAGISMCPRDKTFSDDGFEFLYQTNFLSSFLLTHFLEAQLSPTGRVILTSSIGSYAGFINNSFAITKSQMKVESGFHALATPIRDDNIIRYAQTKLMQAAFARALQLHFDRDRDGQRSAFSFEPGLVRTNVFAQYVPPFRDDPISSILSAAMPYFGIDIRQGAATGVHLATSNNESVVENKGRYFDRLKPRTHQADILSQSKLDRLWARWSADLDISWT